MYAPSFRCKFIMGLYLNVAFSAHIHVRRGWHCRHFTFKNI